jgi:hypothetical protein
VEQPELTQDPSFEEQQKPTQDPGFEEQLEPTQDPGFEEQLEPTQDPGFKEHRALCRDEVLRKYQISGRSIDKGAPRGTKACTSTRSQGDPSTKEPRGGRRPAQVPDLREIHRQRSPEGDEGLHKYQISGRSIGKGAPRGTKSCTSSRSE